MQQYLTASQTLRNSIGTWLMFPFICNEEAMFNTMRSEMEHVLQFTDGYFDLAWYAEKLGRSNECSQLALSAKAMPVRPSSIHILWAALFFLVSKLLSSVQGKAHGCCAVLPLPALKCSVLGRQCMRGSAMAAGEERGKGFLCCWAVHSFPILIGIRFSFPQKRNGESVICLLISGFWTSFKS